jgi:hypothetical protein
MTVGQIDSQPSVATPLKSDLRCGSSPSRHELFQITACEIPTHEVADQVMRWAKIETALEHEHLG